LRKDFQRLIKTQTVLPLAGMAAMLFWVPIMSGRIDTRKAEGWQALAMKLINLPTDFVA
jgi:hypothetical protein